MTDFEIVITQLTLQRGMMKIRTSAVALVLISILVSACGASVEPSGSTSSSPSASPCDRASDELLRNYSAISANSMDSLTSVIVLGQAEGVKAIQTAQNYPSTEFGIRSSAAIRGQLPSGFRGPTYGTTQCPMPGFPEIAEGIWAAYFLGEADNRLQVVGAVALDKADIDQYLAKPRVITPKMQKLLTDIGGK
ncbi:hypothetical protein [Tsukamurella pseudospumae]|uniref:Uncharacterized protein n=1 Tax=Tsukamurella pseudospumae TaxID=239498 RepID=A0A138AMI7_9ACTN|nr:hypothetical protein [Tsukamurella pseudospumae]KXP11625.1 hypothetical protein AXK60_24755 [Tsukamurella pseudospumae]